MRPNGPERAAPGRKMSAMVPPDQVIITFYAPGVDRGLYRAADAESNPELKMHIMGEMELAQ